MLGLFELKSVYILFVATLQTFMGLEDILRYVLVVLCSDTGCQRLPVVTDILLNIFLCVPQNKVIQV